MVVVAIVAAVGLAFTLITNGYIEKSLRRQRQIMAAVWSQEWMERLSYRSQRSNSFLHNRLNWFDPITYGAMGVMALTLALFSA